MDPIDFAYACLKAIIDNLKLTSSCGIDGIKKFLKNTSAYCFIILQCLFSQSYNSGTLPKDWKMGKIVPLHKSGDANNLSNYRPITLTSVPSKIMEHVIFSHLVEFLEENCFFCLNQHAFRKGFSCETQLLKLTNDLHVCLDSGYSVDCMFLDFAKAFDKVNYSLLLYKMSALNIDPTLLNWVLHFLTSRVQFVTANDNDSPLIPVDSGIPQESVLGPILFLIYVNDLPNNISSQICLFADDCVIYRKVSNDTDTLSIQADLNNISQWCC